MESLLDHNLWPISYGPLGDKALANDKSQGSQNPEQFAVSPCSPPLYQSPNRWVPATPTTIDEEEEDRLGEMNFVFQRSEIKTKNILSQQERPKEKCKTGTLRTYNTI